MQHQRTPKDEMNGLLNEAIKMALHLVEAHGHHVPFSMVVTALGERIDVVPDDTETQDLEILFQIVHHRIVDGVREGQFRAVALAKNLSFRLRQNETPTPAIQITLDHARNAACTCYLPYRIENGRVIPGEVFATDAVEQFFQKS